MYGIWCWSQDHADLHTFVSEWGEGYWKVVTKCEIRNSWYLLIKNTVFVGVWKSVYLSNTHPLTGSQVYPPSNIYDMNTTFSRDIMLKERRKVTQTPTTTCYDIVTTIRKENTLCAGFRQAIEAVAWKWLSKLYPKPCPQNHVLNMFESSWILFPYIVFY